MNFRIIKTRRGMGGTLSPPGHPNHEYVVFAPIKEWGAEYYTITRALTAPEIPIAIKKQITTLLANANLDLSEDWIRRVYRYFHNCYAPNTESPAIRFIRKYDPHHIPRTDLL